ncbi:MAG: hypothetical protein HC853_02235 [Anaerolineae bacterium]|nr:hypothetical protein [Anaerolineae bacterium]
MVKVAMGVEILGLLLGEDFGVFHIQLQRACFDGGYDFLGVFGGSGVCCRCTGLCRRKCRGKQASGSDEDTGYATDSMTLHWSPLKKMKKRVK